MDEVSEKESEHLAIFTNMNVDKQYNPNPAKTLPK